MQQHDPGNSRRQALDMFIALQPPDAALGLWTFERYVNTQLRPGRQSARSEKAIEQALDALYARGRFNNVESALNRASTEWALAASGKARHLILLTDRGVDLPGGDPARRASNGRIVARLVPRFRHAGVQVHVVALGDAPVDDSLKRLVTETAGSFQRTSAGHPLMEAFARIHGSISGQRLVPATGGKFLVEPFTHVVSVVLPRRTGRESDRNVTSDSLAATANLVPPDTVEKPSPAKAHVRRSGSLRVVVLDKPVPGVWRVIPTPTRPPLVFMKSEIRLVIPDLPGSALPGAVIPVTAAIVRNGRIAKKKVSIEVAIVEEEADPAGASWTSMHDDGKDGDQSADDGRYTVLLSMPDQAGPVSLTVRARFPRFARVGKATVRVTRPVEGWYSGTEESGERSERGPRAVDQRSRGDSGPNTGALRPAVAEAGPPRAGHIVVAPVPDLVDRNALTLIVRLTGPDGSQRMLAPHEAGSFFVYPVPATLPAGEYTAEIFAEGRTHGGEAFDLDLAPVSFLVEGRHPGSRPPATTVLSSGRPRSSAGAGRASEPAAASETSGQAHSSLQGEELILPDTPTLLAFLAINACLALLAAGGWRLGQWRRQRDLTMMLQAV